ncbi:MAG: hypothetical protein PHE55_09295 [Methylococcaceae bacterium]|nr:hypothetical protein [Methylococcaceae bacterium]
MPTVMEKGKNQDGGLPSKKLGLPRMPESISEHPRIRANKYMPFWNKRFDGEGLPLEAQ